MSFGNNLKTLRESKGVSIEELSERTHVGTQIIEDLEAGVFTRISAAVYGSGFVKILATSLGADPTPLREEFKNEYQAWVELKAANVKPKAPPQKFVEKRIPEKTAPAAPKAVPPKPAVAAKPAVKPTPVVAAEAAPRKVTVETSDENTVNDGLGDLFAPPNESKPTPASASVTPPVYEDKPPRRSFADIMAGLSQKVGGEKNQRVAEPPLFSDNLGKKKIIDLIEIKERITDFISMLNPKFVIIAVAAILIICGLCLLLVDGNNKAGETGDIDSPTVVSTEAAELPPVIFSGSALTDNLLPPPDCYAE